MATLREPGQTTWLALLATGLMSLAGGCSSTPHAQAPPLPPDPLLVPPKAPQLPGTPPSQAQAFQPNGVPALPASLTATNPATLAGASGWQGPTARPLQIDDGKSSGPPFLPGQLTSGSKTPQVPGMPGYLPPNPNPKVEEVPDVGKPFTPPVTPTGSWQTQAAPTPPTIPAAPTDADLAKRLRERGVVDQKQDATPDGVRLTCYISRGDGYRILEVTAPDYAAAAQAILKQLDASR